MTGVVGVLCARLSGGFVPVRSNEAGRGATPCTAWARPAGQGAGGRPAHGGRTSLHQLSAHRVQTALLALGPGSTPAESDAGYAQRLLRDRARMETAQRPTKPGVSRQDPGLNRPKPSGMGRGTDQKPRCCICASAALGQKRWLIETRQAHSTAGAGGLLSRGSVDGPEMRTLMVSERRGAQPAHPSPARFEMFAQG